jgi:hypothetical protein
MADLQVPIQAMPAISGVDPFGGVPAYHPPTAGAPPSLAPGAAPDVVGSFKKGREMAQAFQAKVAPSAPTNPGLASPGLAAPAPGVLPMPYMDTNQGSPTYNQAIAPDATGGRGGGTAAAVAAPIQANMDARTMPGAAPGSTPSLAAPELAAPAPGIMPME